MADYRFKTPLTEADVRQLRVGDSVTLDGVVFGVRDANLIRVFDQKIAPPVDWRGAALLHTAPNVRQTGPGKFEALSVGTTTSMRMDRFTEGLLRDHGVRALLGKGGLSARSGELMAQYGACYLSVTGGAAALGTLQLEEIEKVFWEDLMPECIWQFRYKGFGPLTVGIDMHGGNLQLEVQQQAEQKTAEILRRMGVK
ncbi:MAG TPA: fumarate hydratase C-terminal domain-containing protein [Methylomirabilota bacterium]|jgi:L(+)-tartrate dehydratase beta subunit|nr:fumarate hydratase C-terminal domain-containing protein [Methylomirabilota bacterium]